VLRLNAFLESVVLQIRCYAAAAHHNFDRLVVRDGDNRHVRRLGSDLEGISSIGRTLAARIRWSDMFEVAGDVYHLVGRL
jgi:hypothetical protein